MRRAAFAPLLLILLLLGTAVAADARITDTPGMALERFKQAFAKRDHAAEWESLSPGFKLRLNRRAGRNVDVGDYVAVRNTHRNDPRVRELRQWMHTAHVSEQHFDNRGQARVVIRFGAPLLLGKDVTVTMIHHELWQLWIKGESKPYWGFKNSRDIQVFRNPQTNDHTVLTRDAAGRVTWRKTFPAAQVLGYRTLTRWFFHDFGNFEREFLKGAMGSDDRVPPPRR